MTDRVAGFTVTLDADYREDDIEPLRQAIKAFRGVVSVERLVSDPALHIASQRERNRLREKLWQALESD